MSFMRLGTQADLITAIGPNNALPGEMITLGIKVKNIGDTAGQIWTQIYDATTNSLVNNWNKYMAPGEEWEWKEVYPMPDRDWNLLYRVGHFEVEALVDDAVQKVITIGAAPIISSTSIILGLAVLAFILLGGKKRAN